MKKTVIDPDAGSDIFEDLDTPFSRGTVIETDEYYRIFLSGATSSQEDAFSSSYNTSIGEQTTDILSRMEQFLEEVGASMDDVVRVRVYTQDIDEDEFREHHRAREKFFEKAHFPASTLVRVDEVLVGRIEIDLEAIVPKDGKWETDAVFTDIYG